MVSEEIKAFELFQFPMEDLNTFVKASGNSGATVRVQVGNQHDWTMVLEENDISLLDFK